MPLVLPGDVLRLNCASVLGSREYTLKGAPYIDERLFICRVRVMGVESEPLRMKEKTKRRQRRVKKARSKHRYTILRVMEVRGRSEGELEVLQREAGTVDGALLEDGQSGQEGRGAGDAVDGGAEEAVIVPEEKRTKIGTFGAAKYSETTEGALESER